MTGKPFQPWAAEQLASQYDVVIIGSGATGLVSALQAHELGLRPVVLEKMAKLGGNTNRASSGMNAAETLVQLNHHVVDSFAAFYADTWNGGGRENNPDLLHYFTEHAALAIDWLAAHDIRLDDITITGGMHTKRTHRPASTAPIGNYLITKLLQLLDKNQIPVFNQVTAKHIEMTAGRVSGVTVQFADQAPQLIQTRAVVLATGGFGAGKALIEKYRPDLAHYRTTNQPGATGDGARLATAAGAALVDMDKIQVHPTVQQDTDHAFLIGEAVRGEGAILVDRTGHRFVNELATRKQVTDAINALPDKSAYLILNQGVVDHAQAVKFYDSIGLVDHGADVAELADQLQMDKQQLATTIAEWNQAVATHSDSLGRTTGMDRDLADGPYLAIHVAPAVHYTMGGVRVNHLTQALDGDGKPVAGLFVGGEAAGGLHGNNRIGGNSIAETVVFGRQTGQQVFKYLN